MKDIFKDIVGHAIQKKKLSVLLEKKFLPPTILLAGPEGIGKYLIAMRTVMSLHCASPDSPCLGCSDCLRIEQGLHPDFVSVRPNEKGIIPIGGEGSREPGTVRWLLERLSIKSLSGITTALIDGIDRMRPEAQNALLKTIEEPSEGTYLFLIAGSIATVLPTILSRCFIIKFNSLNEDEIRDILAKNNFQNPHVNVVVESSGGSVGNALLLHEEGMLDAVKSAMADIKEQIVGGFSLMENVTRLEKKLGVEKLLDMLLNIYRKNLVGIIMPESGDTTIKDFFGEMLLDDGKTAAAVIRTMMQARMELKRNINLINLLRGLTYIHLEDKECVFHK